MGVTSVDSVSRDRRRGADCDRGQHSNAALCLSDTVRTVLAIAGRDFLLFSPPRSLS